MAITIELDLSVQYEATYYDEETCDRGMANVCFNHALKRAAQGQGISAKLVEPGCLECEDCAREEREWHSSDAVINIRGGEPK